MSRVWRRLNRVGKTAYKFEFTIKVHTVTLECVAGWTPNQVSILWVRRGRRVRTEATSWTTLPGKDTQGVVHWQALEATITLYLDKSGRKFEEKYWTLVVENVGLNGKHKALATKRINMADFVHPKEPRTELRQKYQMKSVATKVHIAEVQVTFLSQFEKKGPATDDDMKSISSEMSELTFNNFDDGYMSETEGENDIFTKPSTEENEKIMREIAAIGQNFQDLSKFNEEEPIAFQPLATNGHPSQESELIDWCKYHTKRHPRVNITDLKESWRDAFGFCAIIHTFRPDIINLENCGEPYINAKLAIMAAGKLGIAPSIDPTDFQSGDLDKLSIITFIHQLHQQFLHDTPTINPALGKEGSGSYEREMSNSSSISHRQLKQSPQHKRRAATVVPKKSELGDDEEERRRKEMIERGRLRLSKRHNRGAPAAKHEVTPAAKHEGAPAARQVLSTSSTSNNSLNDSRSHQELVQAPVKSHQELVQAPSIREESPVIYTRATVHSRSPVTSVKSSELITPDQLTLAVDDLSLMDAVLNSLVTPEIPVEANEAELDVFDELVETHKEPASPASSEKLGSPSIKEGSIGGSSEIMKGEGSNSSSRLCDDGGQPGLGIGLDADEMFREFAKKEHGSPQLEHGSPQLEHGSPQLEHGSPQLEHGSPQISIKSQGAESEVEIGSFTNLLERFSTSEEGRQQPSVSPDSVDLILASLEPSNDLARSVEEINSSCEEGVNTPSEILISEIKTDSMASLDNESLTLKLNETESNIAAAKEAVLSDSDFAKDEASVAEQVAVTEVVTEVVEAEVEAPQTREPALVQEHVAEPVLEVAEPVLEVAEPVAVSEEVVEPVIETPISDEVDIAKPVGVEVDIAEPVSDEVDIAKPVNVEVIAEPVSVGVDIAKPVSVEVDIAKPVSVEVDIAKPVSVEVDIAKPVSVEVIAVFEEPVCEAEVLAPVCSEPDLVEEESITDLVNKLEDSLSAELVLKVVAPVEASAAVEVEQVEAQVEPIKEPEVVEAEPIIELSTAPPTPPTRGRPSLRDKIRGLHDARQKLMKATAEAPIGAHSSSTSLDRCETAVPRGRLPNSSSSQGSSTASIPDRIASERPRPQIAPKSFDRKLSMEKIAALRASPTGMVASPTQSSPVILESDPLVETTEVIVESDTLVETPDVKVELDTVVETAKHSSDKMLSLSELISSFNAPTDSVPEPQPTMSEARPTSAEITCPASEIHVSDIEDDVMEQSPDSGVYLPDRAKSNSASSVKSNSASSVKSNSASSVASSNALRGSTSSDLSQPPPPPAPEPLLMMMGDTDTGDDESEGEPEVDLQQDLKDVRDYITDCHDRISSLQVKLDTKAKILEKQLREAMDSQNHTLEQELLKAWLLSVNERNMLVRKQDALNYLQADEDLETRCCAVVMEKRKYDNMKDLDKSVDDYEREAGLEEEYEGLMKKRETLLRIREEINSISVEEEAEFQSVLDQPKLLQDQSNCRVS